jgi:hypothetical protein
MQTLALLSRDLHRKSVVPIVQNVPVANTCGGQFQTFQSFNRFAPFKKCREFLKRRSEQQLVK